MRRGDPGELSPILDAEDCNSSATGECCFCLGVSGQPEQLLKVEVTILFYFISLFSSKKGLSITFYSCIVLYCIEFFSWN